MISIKDYSTLKLTKIRMNYENAISSKKFHVCFVYKKKQKLREKKKVLMKRHNLDYK